MPLSLPPVPLLMVPLSMLLSQLMKIDRIQVRKIDDHKLLSELGQPYWCLWNIWCYCSRDGLCGRLKVTPSPCGVDALTFTEDEIPKGMNATHIKALHITVFFLNDQSVPKTLVDGQPLTYALYRRSTPSGWRNLSSPHWKPSPQQLTPKRVRQLRKPKHQGRLGWLIQKTLESKVSSFTGEVSGNLCLCLGWGIGRSRSS